jgi:hypothetical protein
LASFCRFVEKKRFFPWKKPSRQKYFAGRKKPPGKNPAKLVLQTFARWKQIDFLLAINLKVTENAKMGSVM